MRIASGVTDQYIYFVAVDATDYVSREPGFGSFTVYRSRNGGTSTAMTTPTINETDATNMPGVYELLLDEDMSVDSGDETQEMVFHITHAGMAPITRTIELFRPKITVGHTLDVTATGAAGIDWGNIENPTATVDLSGTTIGVVSTLSGHTPQTGDNFLQIGVAGAGLTAVPWNASWDAEVQSECADALVAFGPPTNAQMEARTLAAAGYATPTNITAGTITTVTNLTNAPTNGDLTATMKASVTTAATAATPVAASVTGSVGSVTGAVTVGTNNDKAGYSISGAIQTLDALDTAQDSQHSTTRDAISALNDFNPATDTVGVVTSVTNRVTANVDQIAGNATAATNLSLSARGIVNALAVTGTLSTTQMTTDLTEATNDHYNGRIIIWITGALAGQATDITDYVGSTKLLTFTATTEAPANGDQFVIV